MSRDCAKVNFTRDIVSTYAVDTSIEKWENGEHIQGVGFVFPPTVAMKISQLHYFWSHPRSKVLFLTRYNVDFSVDARQLN